MRFIFLSGGLVGFLLAGTASWAADCGAGRIFFDAACGSLIGATLVRWLWSILLRGMRETFVARQRAAIAATAAAAKNKS